jgi:hypothetical protein
MGAAALVFVLVSLAVCLDLSGLRPHQTNRLVCLIVTITG